MKAKRRWIKSKVEGETITEKVLSMNGIQDKEMFLNGKISDMHDISLLNDGELAVSIIKGAINNKETIVIYSDYDTDGSSGASVAVMMLKELGANVHYYTNNRFKQGYGMCISGIDEIRKIYPDVKLIITIDNGIVAFEAAEYLNKLGVKLVITDHHEQGEKLPIADAVVNPKRIDSTYPFDGICGAVVAWKVLRELYEDKNEANKYLDILAIATVGDVVPLIDENRIIVKEGLKLLNNNSRKSLAILKEETETTIIDSYTLGFLYSPIFNAVSRLNGDINPVIEMLMSEDEEFIRKTARELIEINEKRKRITNLQLELAEELLEKKGLKEVIVLYNESFDEGVVGLIAGRLKEKYNRPVLVLTKSDNGEFIKGSARSIKKFDIKKNLDKCSDLLLGYGGHTMAGGLSLEMNNLEKLENRLIKLAKELLTEDDYVKEFYYVDILKEEDITMDLIEELRKLEPYGEGFQKPLFRLHNFNVSRVFTMGSEKEHLKLVGEDLTVLAWRQVENYKERGNPLRVTALGYPEINIFNNNVNLQFIINEDNFI